MLTTLPTNFDWYHLRTSKRNDGSLGGIGEDDWLSEENIVQEARRICPSVCLERKKIMNTNSNTLTPLRIAQVLAQNPPLQVVEKNAVDKYGHDARLSMWYLGIATASIILLLHMHRIFLSMRVDKEEDDNVQHHATLQREIFMLAIVLLGIAGFLKIMLCANGDARAAMFCLFLVVFFIHAVLPFLWPDTEDIRRRQTGCRRQR